MSGLKIFCSYKTGYNLGLRNGYYQNICPKNLEPGFFKGYTLGLQEYKAEQRQKELLAIEQQKIAVERERIEEQRSARDEFLKLQNLGGQQLCDYNSDCHSGGKCKYNYNYRLKDYVCQYDLKLQNLGGQQLCDYNSDCHSGGKCKYNYRLKDYACRY